MKLSTKGRYGLRAMIDLALHQRDGYISLISIANRQDLSMNYLENIFSSLKKAGLVVATAGLQGGYRLADEPGRITLLSILTALEGSLSVGGPGHTSEKTRFEDFLKREVWDPIDQNLDSLLTDITLSDMLLEIGGQNLAQDCAAL